MKTRSYNWLIAAALILVGLLSATSSQAGEEQSIDMRSMYDASSKSLFMEWYVIGETQPVKFELYHFTGYTKEAGDLTLYGELLPDSTMSFEEEGYMYTVYADQIAYNDSTPATLYIKATWADGSVQITPLNYIDIWEPNYDYVTFETDPISTAKIGEAYLYDADAKAQSGKEIVYSLIYGPEGAQIDPATGKVTWTPTEYGRYDFQIYATTLNDENGYYGACQSWVVKIRKCDKLSTISGTVKDQNGNPLEYGYVELVDQQDSLYYYGYYSGSEIIDGAYEIKDVDEGSYFLVVYVKDYYGREPKRTPVTIGCNDNKTVNIVVKTPDLNNLITINSTPEETIKFGGTYTYDVNASAPNANLDIKYYMIQAPEGATIDENTGLIVWGATEPGIYYFTVEARSDVNEEDYFLNAYQSWRVKVIQCETPSTIKLAVKFDNEAPLTYGVAYLVSKTKVDSCYYDMIQEKAEIRDGSATFVGLDKGTYYLLVEDYGYEGGYNNYYQHWYENAFDISDATPIEIECAEERNLTMTLTAPPEPNYYTVSGRVTDVNGEPVKNAMVELYSDNYDYVKYHETYYQAYTDEDGKYSISAADDQEYIAVAYFMPDSSNWNIQFYFMPIYYNQTTDPSEAERIKLTGDRNDINFELPEAPHFENSVSGKITDENDLPIGNSYVMLYLVEPSEEYSEWLYFGFAATTKDDGTYEATNLIPGKYVVFTFSPYREKCVPGYYKEGEPSTQNWEDATLVLVGPSSEIKNIDIKLGEAKGIVGVGTVNGNVYGDEKKQILKGSDETGADNPIAGANVYAINEKGEIAGSAQTATDGGFLIKGLSKGTYTLNIDKVGYLLSNVNITLNDDNAKSNAEVNIQGKNTGVNDKEELASAKLFPNPAAETLKLDFTAEGSTRISLVNSLGVKVYVAQLGSLSGNSTHSIELGSYPQGAYYAIVESGSRATALPVIITK